MQDTALHFKSVTEIGSMIKLRQVSPVELTQALLTRIAQLDSRFKSYATVMADHALRAAKTAEQEIGAGTYRGPLHGVPVAVKDLVFTQGVRTMGGTKVLAHHVPDFDATVIARLRDAGAVVLGKLNLTEGAMGGYHPDFAIPVNPWGDEYWSGASSSGCGVATAAGLCFASLGTDTGGSIRFPAAACGVVGLKPTWGRVSRRGVLALAESLDHVGPLARTVADAAIMLQAIAGHDPHDPTSLLEPVPDFFSDIASGVKGLRLGVDQHYSTAGVDAELAAAIMDGIRLLESMGAEIVEVKIPDLAPLLAAWPTLCTAEAVAAHAATYPSRRNEYGPWFRGWLDRGSGVSGAAYAQANNLRAACNGLLREVWAGIDVLACPSMPTFPYPVTAESLYGPMPPEGLDMSPLRFTAPYDFNGAPTLSVPCGSSRDGLPGSLQFIGKPLGEALLCRVGNAYEKATEWHTRRPPA